MKRAWRNELLAVVAIVLASLVLGLLMGDVWLPVAIGLIGYLSWHAANFLLLQSWIAHRKSSRLPVSFGIWEAVFDGLQKEQLRWRRRKRQLTSHLFDCREAAGMLKDALVVLSEEGSVRWFNPTARTLIGLKWPSDLNRDIREVIAHPAFHDDLPQSRSSRPLEILSPVNGACMLNIQLTAHFGNQKERLLLARDVTESYHLERARSDFLASVSHELRTPITVFRGYLEALQDVMASDSEWQKPVNHMHRQAQRMQALVDDLLTLSRLEMLDRPRSEATVPVSELLKTIVSEARAFSGEQRHDLHLWTDPTISLRAEERELHSVFSNLIFNAVRHTSPNTRVKIDWRETLNGATFTVQDFGPGIAAQHLPRLTERFYRVDGGRSRRTGGSGLGLAIVKQVLSRYSAELNIISKEGIGSTFSCQFPAAMVEKRQTADLIKAG